MGSLASRQPGEYRETRRTNGGYRLRDTFSDAAVGGSRFAFGENWARFLKTLNDERITEAERSLREALGDEALYGRTFLDVGSGSGLFSLAARRLGALVHSFDYDPASVACTLELRRRYFPDDEQWNIERGSILDREFLATLGTFDVVYAWGVLHHTGEMWDALGNVVPLVASSGFLYLALYNDQGRASRIWKRVKRAYVRAPRPLQPVIAGALLPYLWGPTTVRDVVRRRPGATWRQYVRSRGMSPWIDVVDWVGGYPFEVVKPEEVFSFFRQRGFLLMWLRTCGGGLGNNQFVFQRADG